jgi:hypothetical protein
VASRHHETALAHGDEDKIRATYNRAGYEPERRRLADWWARREAANVLGSSCPSPLSGRGQVALGN